MGGGRVYVWMMHACAQVCRGCTAAARRLFVIDSDARRQLPPVGDQSDGDLRGGLAAQVAVLSENSPRITAKF